MNFKELDQAIDQGLNAVRNYQFVVICHLSKQRGLRDTKINICEALVKNNPGARKENGDLIDYRHYMNCPVWRALSQTKPIISIDKSSGLVTLRIDLTNDQRDKISKKCKGLFRN